MDEENKKMHISETQLPTEFSIEDILAEFGGDRPPEPPAESARESVMGTGREADIRIFRENFEKYGRNFQNPLTRMRFSIII